MENTQEHKQRLESARDTIRELRREYNYQLDQYVMGERQELNGEDLMRLVGSLEATYNHLLAAIAGDGDIYCVLKHLSYAIILAGEMDDPDVEELYDVMSVITNGKIEACMACKREEDGQEEDS